VPTPRVDAEHLVAHVLGVTRSGLYASDHDMTEEEERGLEALVERRRRREPLAYVLGEWGFRHLTLAVDPRVLVPRPETEELVERCLERLKDSDEPHVLDVGVGSGAIALAIAEEHPGARVLAVDRSADALAVAADNLARSSVDGRVELRQGDLLAGLTGPFDLVVSNPPYVSPAEYETLDPEIRLYEPREAIVGVGIGAEIASEARAVFTPGGWLLLECGDGQAPELADELTALGYRDVGRARDLAGRDRIVEGRWE
jgi:release factor glutamine methyltransferase